MKIPDVVYATVPAPCPKCRGVVQENYRKFQCQKCDFALWKVTSGREWSPEEVAELFAAMPELGEPASGRLCSELASGTLDTREHGGHDQRTELWT